MKRRNVLIRKRMDLKERYKVKSNPKYENIRKDNDMTKKERMVAALCHQPVDRIPRGELGIEGRFIANFFKDTTKPMSALEKEEPISFL